MLAATNVLYVETGTFGGGSFESLYVLLKHLDRRHFNPVVLFLNETKYTRRIRELGIPCYTLRDPLYTLESNPLLKPTRGLHQWIGRYSPSLSVLWEYLVHGPVLRKIPPIIRRHRIEVIHSNDHINRDFFVTYLARRHSLKLVSHLRTFTGDGFNRFKAAHANRIVKRYISISKSVQVFWEKRGLDGSKMVTVYNGIERPSLTPVHIREEMGIRDDDTRLLGAVGTYNRQRGYEFLLRSLSLLTKRSEKYRLLVIGNGNRRNLADLVDGLSLGPYVCFLEHVERAVDYIAEMDCLIIPYEVEPFGRVLLEAWMVKTPVILTDADYIKDVVVEGKSCVLVKYGDAEGLAKRVEGLLGDERSTREMTDFAYRLVNERYGVRQYVEGIQRIYEALAN